MSHADRVASPQRELPQADPAERRPFTSLLAKQACGVRFADLHPDLVELSRLCLLDYFGVALAGAGDDCVRILLDVAAAEGVGTHPAIGHARRLTLSQSALVNGTAGHALDYDDVVPVLPGHVTVTILPALLALAEDRKSSGQAVVEAFVAGFDLGCAVAELVAPHHYNRGYHATATIGAFASAAACARLLRLSPEAMTHALSLAATQAAGLKTLFGTMGKPLHAGKAAQSGLLAALLAERGFQGAADIVECAGGFADVAGEGIAAGAVNVPRPTGSYLRMNLFKFHASCYGTQGSLNAAVKLRGQQAFDVGEIEQIAASVGAVNRNMCNIVAPRTGTEAKFSLRLMIACGLTGVDTAALETFNPALCERADLRDLCERTAIDFDERKTLTEADLTITLRGGRTLRQQFDAGVAETDLVALRGKLEAKFASLVAPHRAPDAIRDLVALVRGIDRWPNVAGLTEPFSESASNRAKLRPTTH